MTISSTPRALLAAALVAGAALLATTAHAQDSKKKEALPVAPTPPSGKSDIPWTPYAAAIVLGLLVVGVNFIPSKRGHQD